MNQDRPIDISDEMLMELFQRNKDPKIFTIIYDRYFVSLSKYIYWLTNDIEKGKDIAQNILVKLYSKPHLFDATRNFKVWLFSIAKNKWKNDLRHKYAELRFVEKISNNPDQRIEYDEATSNEKRAKRVENAMNQLSEDHKEVIVLKYSNNLTINEIAEILNCSSGTVKSRLFYSLNKLKKLL